MMEFIYSLKTRIMRRQVALVLAIGIAVMLRKTTSGEVASGNLAFLKETNVSSQLNSDTTGSRAVNGRVDDYSVSQHFFSSTTDNDPYWYVDLGDMYLVQTVEVFSRRDGLPDRMETIEVRVGESLNGDGGKTNPLCGQPKNMNNIPKHTFRCEVQGKYVTVKKANPPALYALGLFEVMVNKEPSPNVASKRPTRHSSYKLSYTKSNRAVDGIFGVGQFRTAVGALPHWLMIDFEEARDVHKVFVLTKAENLESYKKIIMTIGNDLTDNGKHNAKVLAKIGDVHDFSKTAQSVVYVWPRMHGRYFYFESQLSGILEIREIEIYEETLPFITLRTDEPVSRSRTFYEGHVAVLQCPATGYPRPHIMWMKDGVFVQNNTQQHLRWIVNATKGSSSKYECYATNIHGKDYFPITVTIAGRHDMCMKPEEIRDPTRNILSKEDPSAAPKSDDATFQYKMNTFFNPQSFLYMKLVTSCPPTSSCGTGAPGWLTVGHPKPEDGIVRRKVCIHYNGDCCYRALYISVVNCPGMFVYALENSGFNFPMRYCFEDDKNDEAFAPFTSVPRLLAPAGGSNTALVNHVIEKHHGIEDTSQCLVVCMMKKCRSFNFDKVGKICEVNDVTKDEYPRDLTAKPGFQYYHPMKQPIFVRRNHN